MKIIKCKNVNEYEALEKIARDFLGIPNLHHKRYAPPPNNSNFAFPITPIIESIFTDHTITEIDPIELAATPQKIVKPAKVIWKKK